MELLESLLNAASSLDQVMVELFRDYGLWMYAALFLFLLLEATVTPFFPGDSVVFAVGAASASGGPNLVAVWVLFILGTVFGTMTSYEIGRRVGPRAFRQDRRFLNADQLEHARRFFGSYGGRTLAIGRFVPVVRTFAPVVAGILRMDYVRFLLYTTLGSVLWVTVMLLAGYFVETVPALRARFGLVFIVVFMASLGPPVIEWFWEHVGRRAFRAIMRKFVRHARD